MISAGVLAKLSPHRTHQQYDSGVQVPVCPHKTVEKVEQERKARERAETTPSRLNQSGILSARR
jgi:hypothetical protein